MLVCMVCAVLIKDCWRRIDGMAIKLIVQFFLSGYKNEMVIHLSFLDKTFNKLKLMWIHTLTMMMIITTGLRGPQWLH